jgi:hypothetical protein
LPDLEEHNMDMQVDTNHQATQIAAASALVRAWSSSRLRRRWPPAQMHAGLQIDSRAWIAGAARQRGGAGRPV